MMFRNFLRRLLGKPNTKIVNVYSVNQLENPSKHFFSVEVVENPRSDKLVKYDKIINLAHVVSLHGAIIDKHPGIKFSSIVLIDQSEVFALIQIDDLLDKLNIDDDDDDDDDNDRNDPTDNPNPPEITKEDFELMFKG